MANQLTDSEAKMLRDHAIKYGLVTIFRRPQDAANSEAASLKAMAALSELLLAAKARAVREAESHMVTSYGPHGQVWEHSQAGEEIGEALRGDWGDLFEGKL